MEAKRKHLELRPNRSLLDPNFEGYKLSLEAIPVKKATLPFPVDRVQPSQDQYSLLYTRIFALHNHLYYDTFDENSVYYIDSVNWTVQKCSISEEGIVFQKVWNVPITRPRQDGDFNLSLNFVSDGLVIVGDGTGTLHIAETGQRSLGVSWKSVFCDKVIPDFPDGFIILDARFETNQKTRSIHCILSHIEQNQNSKHYETILNWITLTESGHQQWSASAWRQLTGRGSVYYCSLEPRCEAIYLASNYEFKFMSDSENSIKPEAAQEIADKPKLYIWQQTSEDITITLSLQEDKIDKDKLKIDSQSSSLLVRYNEKEIFNFENFYHMVDPCLTTWELIGGIIKIQLVKNDENVKWLDLLKGGDEFGEQVFDPALVEEAHKNLAHLCSDKPVTSTGYNFTGQQLEECDAPTNDEFTTLERISTLDHKSTHSVTLSDYQILFTKDLHASTSENENLNERDGATEEELGYTDRVIPKAFCVRYDVDACLWQPIRNGNEWQIRHEGTLLAFGFVQASKQQRKFLDCSPDMSYSVIAESTRHVFIYRQHKAVDTDCQLRNRTSGRRVRSIAQQQVIEVDGEILGMYAANSYLFLLTTNQLLVYQIFKE